VLNLDFGVLGLEQHRDDNQKFKSLKSKSAPCGVNKAQRQA